jgi:hypothetical protein
MEETHLLNEKNEINALISGERINKKYTYRSCYLLAKYFKELGFDTITTRTEIFSWAKKYQIYISDDLNSIIQRAFTDKKELSKNIEIKISKEDINEIVKRFDKYNTRLTAFAILCFAKKHADKNGMFYMSRIGLSNWIKIDQTSLSSRHIKELVDFGYLEKASYNDIKFIKKRNKHVSKTLIYRIKVNYNNSGEFIIYDNDFRKEFEEIIINYDTIYCVTNNNCTK